MTIDRPAPEQIPQLRSLWQQAFGDSEAFLDDFFSTGFSPDRCRCITVADRPAAALYWFPAQCEDAKLAYLYAVATDAAFRGQGLCHKLMENTHRHLAAQGFHGTLLVPGSSSLVSFYAGMGYAPFSTIREFSCAAKYPAVPLRKVDASEYAALRAELLPPGGVLQEGATLTFLQTQTDFYAGDHVLLAAVKAGDTLTVPELLGDPACAPGIVAQLGATKGLFRTPGDGRTFAMYRCLSGKPLAGGYFGLALD